MQTTRKLANNSNQEPDKTDVDDLTLAFKHICFECCLKLAKDSESQTALLRVLLKKL